MAAHAEADDLASIVAVEKLGPNEYVSKTKPVWMGNAMRIAYGGYTLGVGISAACDSVPDGFAPYSIVGHFLGPASTDRKVYCSVQEIRNTRSFVTRRVQLKQEQKDGSFRPCMELTADFQIIEPSAAADFQDTPRCAWPKPQDCPTFAEHAETLLQRGTITKRHAEAFEKTLGSNEAFFETRGCPNGVGGQNLMGLAKNVVTTQDHLSMTSKTSAEWNKAYKKLDGPAANFAAAGFLMDGALAFIPLTHGHQWFEDVGACSTLDFALRFFVPSINMDKWNLKERWTIRGGHGRTYSEARLWSEDGQLTSSMTQQCVLRPAPQSTPKSKI